MEPVDTTPSATDRENDIICRLSATTGAEIATKIVILVS